MREDLHTLGELPKPMKHRAYEINRMKIELYRHFPPVFFFYNRFRVFFSFIPSLFRKIRKKKKKSFFHIRFNLKLGSRILRCKSFLPPFFAFSSFGEFEFCQASIWGKFRSLFQHPSTSCVMIKFKKAHNEWIFYSSNPNTTELTSKSLIKTIKRPTKSPFKVIKERF